MSIPLPDSSCFLVSTKVPLKHSDSGALIPIVPELHGILSRCRNATGVENTGEGNSTCVNLGLYVGMIPKPRCSFTDIDPQVISCISKLAGLSFTPIGPNICSSSSVLKLLLLLASALIRDSKVSTLPPGEASDEHTAGDSRTISGPFGDTSEVLSWHS